jgi:hypothetical protein
MSSYEYTTQGYRPQQQYGFQEFEGEVGSYEYEGEYEEEFGTAQEGQFGEVGSYEYEGEYEEEFGTAQEGQFGEVGQPGQLESPLNEAQEMNLASQLLEVNNEEELEQFLGNLIRGVGRAVGGFMRSGVGRAVGGILKNVARTALPVVGGAIGSFVAPGVGTALGTQLGSMASRLFEVEMEGMDREEQEFEVARRFVRLAAGSAAAAARAPRGADPQAVARSAVLAAARRYAPGVARRFRRFARPAPWYWPYPIAGGGQPGYGADQAGYGTDQAGYGGQPAYGGQPDSGGQPGYAGDEGEPEAYGAPMDGQPGMQGAYGPMAPGGGMNGNGGRPRSGRWIMRGRRLIVLGI